MKEEFPKEYQPGEEKPQLSKKIEVSLEEQEHYEDITRESLFRIRALHPLMGEKSPLSSGQNPWGLESFQMNKEEFLTFVEGTGKTLEYYGTSEEELKCLEARIEAIHWLRIAKHTQDGPNKIGSGEVEQIINSALKAVGSNLEEIEELQKTPERK